MGHAESHRKPPPAGQRRKGREALLTLEKLALVGGIAEREWVAHRPVVHGKGLVVEFTGAGHAARSEEGGLG